MDAFTTRFTQFAEALTEATDFDDTADQLIAYAVTSVGASFGGITLLRGNGRLETIGATDPRVTAADRAQYTLREGPCVGVAHEARSCRSSAIAVDRRWPRWGPAAAELGIQSVLSAEIHGRGARIGALNVYSLVEDAFSAEDVEIAIVLAAQSASVLAATRSEQSLREALESRTLIGQAQGILMERFSIDAGRAFSVLRRYSQDSNTRLREVAEQLVTTRRIP